MSELKKFGSLVEAMYTLGCAPNQFVTDVVPHLGAPIMKRFGFFILNRVLFGVSANEPAKNCGRYTEVDVTNIGEINIPYDETD